MRMSTLVAGALLLLGPLATPSWAQRLRPADAATRVTAQEPLLGLPATVAARPLTASAPAQRPTAAISSTATGGNWSAPGTWVGGVVPTAADAVTIVSGATVTLDVAAAAGSLTINSGGTLGTSAATSYSLQVGGSVLNNGTMALSASSTVGSDLRFVSAGSVTFGGTGTTDLFTMSLAKGALADVVDMNLPTLTVKTGLASATGFLSTRITTNTVDDMTGTLKISGTATITARVFSNAAAYVIPATGAFWLSNPNYTVAGQTGSPTVNGQLRLSAGTFNVGTSSGNSISFGASSVLTVDGGTLNSTGRVGNFTAAASVTGSMTFTLSSGTLNVSTIGNASGTPSFGVNGTTTISGGVINLVQRSTATTPLDYYVAGTYNFTGGTLNVGTAATAVNFDFRIRGSVPNLTIDNTTNPKSVLLAAQTNPFGTATIQPTTTLNLNGFILLQIGPGIVNNGTLTGTVTGSRLYFQGSAAQSLSGTGTVTTPLLQITFQNSGPGVTISQPLTTRNVAMFRGNVFGSNNLTVQATSTALAIVSFGLTSPTASAGSFDVAPTYDLAASGLYLIYNPELAARTTGVEVPASRQLYYADFNNPQGVTVTGGNLTVFGPSSSSSSLSLLAGIVTTSATSKLISGVATTVMPAGSATAYIRGPFGITVNSATAVSRLFAVGDVAGFRPVVVGGITNAADQTYTATVINGPTGGTPASPLTGLNPTRYVRLENTAALPASATVQLSYGADDVVGTPANAVVAQAPTAAGTYASIGGAAATTPTTGIVSTQPITPGNEYFVLASTEGGTLASSVTSGCAGATSGTLTLSGNASGSTVVKYQADTGSGFVDVPGTNTGTTYAFSNLTTTTTFRAVLTTSDGRTVYSAPVTVTVTPTASSAFSYPAGPYCVSGATNPTPTVTGAAGGTFSSTSGLTINTSTGVVTLASSTPGTYTVTYTSGGTCPSSSTQQLVINAAPTAGFSYPAGPYCVSGTNNPTATLASGATAGTFTASPAGLTLNAGTGAITLGSSTAGTYTVTNTVAASNGCAAVTSTATLTINAAPSASFSYSAGSYCASGTTNPTVTLGAGATAGTFTASPAGLTLNATTGAITLSSSTTGTYTVTNTVAAANGCAAVTATATVSISTATSAGFSYGAGPFCVSGPTNPTVTLASGATAGTFTASPAGLTIDASTGTVTLSSSTPGTYTVTNTVAASGSCAAASSTATITLNAAPTAGFSYPAGPYCVSGTNNPTATLASGATAGTFTANPAGLTLNATTGAITLSSSTAGTYTVTNTVAAANGCAAVTSTQTVVINAAPAAGFSYGAGPFCVSGTTNPTATLAAGATAGTFTASPAGLTLNATTGAITLSSSTPGTYTVTNTVAASGGCAAVTSTATITINAAPLAGFSYGTSPFCVSGTTNPTATLATGATAGAFTSSPAGLTLNATTGAITLSSSTPGTYTVTNTVAAAGGCAAVTSTATVIINAAPLAGFSYGTGPFCVSGATNPTATLATGATAGTFTASPAGLTLNATTGAITLSSSTPGTYTVTNTVAASGGCAAVTSTASVTITAAPTASFSYATPGTGGACAGGTGTIPAVLGVTSVAGTFTASPAGLTINPGTGVISLSGSTAGTYTITNTVAASGGCAAVTATATFTINPVPATPTITVTGTTGVTLTASAASSYQFYRGGQLIPGATGQSYIVLSGAGNGSYTVTVTNASGCSATSAPVNVTVTGTQAAHSNLALTLHPNPTPDGQLTLTLDNSHEAAQLQVLNALGQQMLETRIPAGTTTYPLDLGRLASGVYTLHLRTASGEQLVRRFVRQ